jgi:hypothetical protein
VKANRRGATKRGAKKSGPKGVATRCKSPRHEGEPAWEALTGENIFLRETAEVSIQKQLCFFFIRLTSIPPLTLFTSCSHPVFLAPGLRRQIRNRGLTAQEKTGTLFYFCAQKILDGDDTLAGSIFASKAIFRT